MAGRWNRLRSMLQWRVAQITTADQLLAERSRYRIGGVPYISADTALRNSAVWACLRLRANLVSTMPLDVYRVVGDVRVSVPPPPVLVRPGALYAGGEPIGIGEWLYATQVDLDRSGNAFGLITERNALGLPSRIDLVALADVAVRVRDGVLRYRIGDVEYSASEVWHERQYVQAGLPVGLSPVAYAALVLGEYASAQELAMDWYAGTAIPAAHLRNNAKTLKPGEAGAVKARYQAMIEDGGLFVSGADWEFKPIQAVQAMTDYLEVRRYGLTDVARFFDVPSDLIDAAVSGSSVTYANVTERDLQFLTMSLGPALTRRETALNGLTPTPRFVKLNRNALLAMTPAVRATVLKTQVDGRALTPNEWRALEDRPPLTESDMAEFDRLFGSRQTAPATTPTNGVPA